MINREKLIISLQEGVLFEDTGNILRWKTPLEELKTIDNPNVVIPHFILEWKNKKCLGGEILNVYVEKNEYKNNNNYLEFIDLKPVGLDQWATYNRYSVFFQELLGEPTQFKKDNFDYPTSLWNVENLQVIIGVAERFEEYSIFGIHYGEPYWELY